jgi:hypothetical protein
MRVGGAFTRLDDHGGRCPHGVTGPQPRPADGNKRLARTATWLFLGLNGQGLREPLADGVSGWWEANQYDPLGRLW